MSGKVIARIVYVVAFLPLFATGLVLLGIDLMVESLALLFANTWDALSEWSGWW